MRIFFVLIAGCALILGIAFFAVREPISGPLGEFVPGKIVETKDIKVFAPLPGAKIKSPLAIRGEARGGWYFEASFPVRLKDASGQELVVSPAQAIGEWMTSEFVPFEAELSFEKPKSSVGVLILEKDNPSGLPEYDESVSVPIIFD